MSAQKLESSFFDFDARLKKLWVLLKAQHLSASHQLDHLVRVAAVAQELAELYAADPTTVVAAALVHDLGRSDPTVRGADTATLGAELARPVLEEAGFEGQQLAQIVQCVAEHDQPGLHSELLEARILKDADFLDGFGARGIVRSLIYAGETGGGLPEALERLQVKTRQRLAGLEFQESRRLAWRQTRLTEYLVDELSQVPNLEEMAYPGKLIIFEGLSGSGKNTQMDLLQQFLEKKGQKVIQINHPSDFFKQQIWPVWRSKVGSDHDHDWSVETELLLLAVERLRLVREVIWPALRAGQTVLSSRSGMTAQVYQAKASWPSSFTRLLFSFEPVADAIFYLKLSPAEAAQRVAGRVEQSPEQSADADPSFFPEQTELAKRYEATLEQYPFVTTLAAAAPPPTIAAQIQTALEAGHFFS